jgi:hypothetical protein
MTDCVDQVKNGEHIDVQELYKKTNKRNGHTPFYFDAWYMHGALREREVGDGSLIVVVYAAKFM